MARRRPWPGVKRPWLMPLVPLWALGVWGKGLLLRAGLLRVRRLGWPVVSVGSVSAGGAGKTPVVMALAALLAREGYAVDVLSRGYGRAAGGVEEVDAGGEARRFGDEPLELARAGLRVFVGADRFLAGSLAEAGAGDARGVHVLDDGFQHRRLGREVEVVLVTAADLRDTLLPAGNLREGMGALRRADALVVREEEMAAVLPVFRGVPGKRMWVVRRELILPDGMPSRPMVFCGIARPDGFTGMLRAAGVEAVGTHLFGDHHAYGLRDFELLAEAGRHAGADGFVTTAKDAVKISAAGRAALERVGPVVEAGLRARFVEEERVLGHLRQMLPVGSKAPPVNAKAAREKIGS